MDSSSLLDRLERLEKRNQLLTNALVLGVTMIAALLAIAACSPEATGSTQEQEPQVSQDAAGQLRADTLVVKDLILEDNQGRTAARLSWDADWGTSLTFFAANGDEAVKLTSWSQGSRLTLSADGNPRVDLEAESALGISTLRLFDNEKRVAVQAGHEGGATTLFLMGFPNESGLRPQLGMVMPPVTGVPYIRQRDLEGNVQLWGVDQ